MSENIKDQRDLLSKPGESILETIDHLKMTQVELAERMGRTPSKVNDLINAKEPITMTTALQLEKVLGIDAAYWINRETLYREKLARIEQAEEFESSIEWLNLIPYKQLKEKGYIKSTKPDAAMVEEALTFFGVASKNQWEEMYRNKYGTMQFRKSSAHQTALGSISAWLRIGELEIQKTEFPVFDKNLFKEVLKQAKQLVRKHPENFAERLQEICKTAGVAVVYTPCLPKAPVSGAVRWIGGNPLIQITDRYRTNDHFWFTFFHEAAHILLHGKKEIFIEEFDGYELDNERETEANNFAANYLLPDSFIDKVTGKISEELIRAVAREYETHPSIVLARLQKLGKVSYSFGKSIFAKVSLEHLFPNYKKDVM